MSMCLCWEERERCLTEAKMLSLLSISYTSFLLSLSLFLSLSLSICVSYSLCTLSMYVLQHSICSLSLPLLSLCLLICPPFLFSLLYIYSGLQTVCSQSQFFPRAPGGEGGREERRGRGGREEGRDGDDSEPCGTCAVHVFQIGMTQICASKKEQNELHSWLSARYLAWDHSQSRERNRIQT